MSGRSGSFIQIDLKAIADNWQYLVDRVAKQTAVGAVIKADGYSLGAYPIFQYLYKKGCRDFFFSNALEAAKVITRAVEEGGFTEADIYHANIYLLTGLNGAEAERALLAKYHNIIPILNSFDQLSLYQSYQNIDKEPFAELRFALKFDTGMGRLGFFIEDIPALKRELGMMEQSVQSRKLSHIFSHLACSEDANDPLNLAQLQCFQEIAAHFPQVKKSLSNSAGVFLGPEYHFDLVRPGAFLYGICEAPEAISAQRGVLNLYAEVIQRKTIQSPQTIGYGGTYKAEPGQKILLVRAGYADGYFRALSNNAFATASRKKLACIGRVSMDMTAFDATSLDDEEFNTIKHVEILGDNTSINEIAAHANTIGYEVLTAIGYRYQRLYNS